jgi:hypothetical protein
MGIKTTQVMPRVVSLPGARVIATSSSDEKLAHEEAGAQMSWSTILMAIFDEGIRV